MKNIKRLLSIILMAIALLMPFNVSAIIAPAATSINVEGIGNLPGVVNNRTWDIQLATSSASYTHAEIEVTPADPTYVVVGDGVIDFVIGETKTVVITVTDPADSTFETYTIVVHFSLAESGGSNPNTGAFVNIGLLAGVSTCSAAIYLFQKNKNKFYKI